MADRAFRDALLAEGTLKAHQVGLFRAGRIEIPSLFADPAEMRADVAGKPVYLGLCTGANDVVRLKPQNLLLNLPLAVQ